MEKKQFVIEESHIKGLEETAMQAEITGFKRLPFSTDSNFKFLYKKTESEVSFRVSWKRYEDIFVNGMSFSDYLESEGYHVEVLDLLGIEAYKTVQL